MAPTEPGQGTSSTGSAGTGGTSSGGTASGTTGSGTGTGTGSGGTSGGTPTPAPGPPSTSQIYNIADAALDAINVSLDSDGTFRFQFDECDAAATACGVWTSAKDGFLLSPDPRVDSNAFSFFDGKNLIRARSVSISLVPDTGTVKVSGVTADGTFFGASTWNEGQVCAKCGAEGPSAVVSCSTPLPFTCQ